MFGIELASGRDDVVPLGTLVHHSGNAESSSVLETEIHVPPRDLLHATALAVGRHIKLTEVTAALVNRTFGSSFGALVVQRSWHSEPACWLCMDYTVCAAPVDLSRRVVRFLLGVFAPTAQQTTKSQMFESWRRWLKSTLQTKRYDILA